MKFKAEKRSGQRQERKGDNREEKIRKKGELGKRGERTREEERGEIKKRGGGERNCHVAKGDQGDAEHLGFEGGYWASIGEIGRAHV